MNSETRNPKLKTMTHCSKQTDSELSFEVILLVFPISTLRYQKGGAVNYFNFDSSCSDETVVAAWDSQVKAAGETPWLAELLRWRGSEFFPRFAACYAALRALPRNARRALQRQVAHSSELIATFPERLSRKEGRPLQRKLARSLAGAALLLALAQGVAQAETINVAAKAPPGIRPDGQCSLIEAIINANADAVVFADCPAGQGVDTIVLPAKANVKLTYAYDNSYGPTGLPLITSPITIEGNGAKIGRRKGQFRLIAVSNSGDLTLQNANLSGGSSVYGGGISNYGTLVIESSIISGNTAHSGGGVLNRGALAIDNSAISKNSAYNGGGISNYGALNITDTTIAQNSAKGSSGYCYYYYFGCYYGGLGGGILNNGTLTVAGSTISLNSSYSGGAMVNNSGDVVIEDSTISKNSAVRSSNSGGPGGGIFNHASLTVTASTISGNSAQSGGGMFNDATVTLNRSLVSGSTASVGPEIADYGTVTSDNFNLFGTNGDGGVAGFVPGMTDIVPARGVKAGKILGPLKNNGGPTATHALKRGSPAVDAIPFSDPGCTGVDQRGVARPQGADCDIGAFEGELR